MNIKYFLLSAHTHYSFFLPVYENNIMFNEYRIYILFKDFKYLDDVDC